MVDVIKKSETVVRLRSGAIMFDLSVFKAKSAYFQTKRKGGCIAIDVVNIPARASVGRSFGSYR